MLDGFGRGVKRNFDEKIVFGELIAWNGDGEVVRADGFAAHKGFEVIGVGIDDAMFAGVKAASAVRFDNFAGHVFMGVAVQAGFRDSRAGFQVAVFFFFADSGFDGFAGFGGQLADQANGYGHAQRIARFLRRGAGGRAGRRLRRE